MLYFQNFTKQLKYFNCFIILSAVAIFSGCAQSPASIFKKRSTDYFQIEKSCPLKLTPKQTLKHHADYDIPKIKKSTPLTEMDLLPPGICF